MKILIIGNGAKELALMQHLMEKGGHDVLVVPGNPGGVRFAQSIGTDLSALEADNIIQTARNFQPDHILIIDENFVRSPIAKTLKDQGYQIFAPDKDAADILYKKCRWTDIFDACDLPCPDHTIVDSFDKADAVIQESSGPWVMTRLDDPSDFTASFLEEEARDQLTDWFSSGEKTHVMICDYLDVPRFYLSSIVKGDKVYPLQSAIIQRGIYENEDDAETKGMGAYSPAIGIDPKYQEKAVEEILKPFFKKLKEDGTPYEGFMAGEFLVDGDDVICCNMKCGLSDCASVLTFLRCQEDIMNAITSVEEDHSPELKWSPKPAVSIVLAASDYPKAPSKGIKIDLDEDFEGRFYPHRTRIEKDGSLVTNGGRVAIVVAEGNDLQDAAQRALESAGHVHCDDLFYRTDIGQLEE